MIKLIIFDLWQTLAYKDVDYSAVSKIFEKTSRDIPKKKFVKIFEESIQTKKWASKYEAYKNLCKNINLETTKKNVNFLIDIRDEVEAKAKLYSHTLSMLKQLKNQGYKIGLISNSSVFATKQMNKKTKLLKYIDYPLFSFEVGVIKPNLKIFEKMLGISKCKPEETIMIGDKLNDDVIPPKKLGMNSIHYKNFDKLKKDFKKFGVNL